MLKKILIYVVAVLAGCYLVFALCFLTGTDENEICKGMEIRISDEYEALSDETVKQLIDEEGINPKGRLLKSINCDEIEQFIKKLSVVEDAQCYKTHKGFVGIRIECKRPIMQAFDINGRLFYIDRKGDIIDGVHSAMYLPVANGFITRDMAGKELLTLAEALHNDRFWNEQIEQIYFNANKEVILVPRIGNHTIELGSIQNIESKLAKLRKFYEKGLNTVGWNKYKNINIEFDKQVICTKRD